MRVQAYHFFSTRSGARERIGEYYEKGLGGVKQDHRTAAIYYAKATDKSNGDAPSIRATLRLAFLYANGLGVPRDRAKARELFLSTGPSTQANVVLLDHNLLPRSMEDVTPSLLQTASALKAEYNAKKARAEEAGQTPALPVMIEDMKFFCQDLDKSKIRR